MGTLSGISRFRRAGGGANGMCVAGILACLLTLLGSVAGVAAAGAEQSGGSPPKPIEASLIIPAGQEPVHVGQEVTVRIILRNTTSGPLMVLDWEKYGLRGQEYILTFGVTIEDYPGQGQESGVMKGVGRFGGPYLKTWFRALPPGETVVERSFTPMLPGTAHLRGGLECWTDKYGNWGEEPNRWPNGWVGHAYGYATIKVASDLPAETRHRYDNYRRTLQDSAISPEEKLKILAEVAGEKHYFAARFIRETYDAAEPGRVKEAALRHLVDLAMFGTAYESFPLLVKVMEQDDAPQDIRLTLLGWIGKVLVRGYQELAEQAFHRYPEPLQEEARQAIQRLAQDRNPFVAAKAQEVIKSLEAKK
jgi:hypothetical protein